MCLSRRSKKEGLAEADRSGLGSEFLSLKIECHPPYRRYKQSANLSMYITMLQASLYHLFTSHHGMLWTERGATVSFVPDLSSAGDQLLVLFDV